jgi:hypothetical protein
MVKTMNAKKAREISIKCSEKQREVLQVRVEKILIDAHHEIERAAKKGCYSTILENCFLVGPFSNQSLSEIVKEKLEEDGFSCILMDGCTSLSISW